MAPLAAASRHVQGTGRQWPLVRGLCGGDGNDNTAGVINDADDGGIVDFPEAAE